MIEMLEVLKKQKEIVRRERKLNHEGVLSEIEAEIVQLEEYIGQERTRIAKENKKKNAVSGICRRCLTLAGIVEQLSKAAGISQLANYRRNMEIKLQSIE